MKKNRQGRAFGFGARIAAGCHSDGYSEAQRPKRNRGCLQNPRTVRDADHVFLNRLQVADRAEAIRKVKSSTPLE